MTSLNDERVGEWLTFWFKEKVRVHVWNERGWWLCQIGKARPVRARTVGDAVCNASILRLGR